MLVQNLSDFVIIYHFKGSLTKSDQETSYKLILSLNVLWGIVIPPRVPAGDCLSPDGVGRVSLIDFICMCPSLIPDSPALLREKTVRIIWTS